MCKVYFPAESMSMPLARKSLLVVVGMLVFFICAEIGLRVGSTAGVLSSEGSPQPTGRIHDFFSFDTDGCFRIVPGSSGLHRPYEGRDPVTVRINSEGFRGPEPRTDSVTRVVFVGDSIVFDGGVPDEKTFVRLAEERLNRSLPSRRCPAECLNLGTTDAGAAQYVAKVKHHALGLRPDLIVVGFYLNDARPPQGFLGEDGYSAAERGLVRSPFYRLLTVRRGHEIYRLVKFSRDKTLSVRFRWTNRFKAGIWTSDRKEWERLVAEAEYDWGAGWVENTWPAVEEHLSMIVGLCRQNGILPAIVCFPVSPQVQVADPFPSMQYPQEKLAEIARRIGVPLLDLLPALREHRQEPLFNDQCHLTSPGNRVVADELAPWIGKLLEHN